MPLDDERAAVPVLPLLLQPRIRRPFEARRGPRIVTMVVVSKVNAVVFTVQ
jgi:hypothetical protein